MAGGAMLDAVDRGEQALVAGDWEEARDSFRTAVEIEPSPEALDGLGRTLWWLGDVDGSIDHRELAYASLRKRGDAVRAARIALWLAREYVEAVGNEPAGNGCVGPGHTPEIFPNTEIVEFSPTADFQHTMEVVGKNMESMG